MDRTHLDRAVADWNAMGGTPVTIFEPMLNWRFTLTDCMEHSRGVAWTGTLTHVPTGDTIEVEQRGNGGANYYSRGPALALLEADSAECGFFEPDCFVAIVDTACEYAAGVLA